MKRSKKYEWIGYCSRPGELQTFCETHRTFKSVCEGAGGGRAIIIKRGRNYIVGVTHTLWSRVETDDEFLKRAHHFKDRNAAEMCARML